jgi:glycosyltransferase involved in cell wall biosynthesis
MLICVVTHNRLEYTKQCLEAIDRNTSPGDDWKVVVVDNASTDGTQEWLQSDEADSLIDHLILNRVNKYPGSACNQGWMMGLHKFSEENFTHLCRLDNDCLVQPGWYEQVKNAFASFDDLGQFGLIEMSEAKEFQYVERKNEETGVTVNTGPTNIGGPMVIDRSLWEEGLRYSEMPWQHFGGPTPQEDVVLSLDVKKMGKTFANTTSVICVEQSFGNTDDYYDYYATTFAQRGYAPPARTKNGEVLEAGSGRDHI